jgi:hypothetical protein
MMSLVARDDVHECSYRDFLPVRLSPTRLFFCTEMLREVNRCRANDLELVDQIIDRPCTEVGVRGPPILVKARKLGLVISCETNGSVRHDPLDVDNVSYHFFDAPLAGRVSKIGAIGSNAAEHRGGLYQLLAQLLDQIPFRDARDVPGVELGVFVGCRPPDRGAVHCGNGVELTPNARNQALLDNRRGFAGVNAAHHLRTYKPSAGSSGHGHSRLARHFSASALGGAGHGSLPFSKPQPKEQPNRRKRHRKE